MFAALVLLAAIDPWKLPPPQSFADCEQRIAEHPREFAAWFCFQQMAYRQPKVEWEKKTHDYLVERIARDKHPPAFAKLTLSLVVDLGGDARKVQEAVADEMHDEKIFEGEVIARTLVATDVCENGMFAWGERELAKAQAAAQASGDPDLISQAETYSANCARAQADYGRAFTLYRSSRERLLEGPKTWRTGWLLGNALDGLGQVYARTGRHQEALEIFQQQVEARGLDLFGRACAEHRVAEEAVRLARQGGMSWDEADAYLKTALDDEVKYGCRVYFNGGEVYTRLLLAERLGPTDEGLAQVQQALELTRKEGDEIRLARPLRLLATLLIEKDPTAIKPALAAVEEAIARAEKFGNRGDRAQSLMTRALVRAKGGQREEGVKDALLALEQFDRLREMQPDEMVRARTATEWSSAYHYVAGLLLEGGAPPQQSFEIMERMRARSLLEELDAQAAPPATVALRGERSGLLGEISQVQRALLTPGLKDTDRETDLARLQLLESHEESLRDQIARINSSSGAAAKSEPPPTLAQLQESLAPDEAVLLFQLFDREGAESDYLQGSSWVLAVSRDKVRALPLQNSSRLGGEVDLLSGLVARRDGSERAGAAVLYNELVGAALSSLDPKISRLTIVPDGPLNRLPFEALRAPDGRALAEKFTLTSAPSAALFLHWRNAPPGQAQVPALALGDPLLGDGDGVQAVSDRRWNLGRRPGPLPAAREEAKAVVRELGRGSELRVGADASEQFVKTADLRRYGVLHIAAHSLVDETRPERSAILLAPGADGEDGLLQLREIAGLNMRGSVVVLAVCDGSSGELLQGEGTMSLARGFFQAGARAVLGSLWPLRDDEAALFFEPFYQRLGEGASLADAVAFARRARIAAGAPAAAWAGLVLLGDGNSKPVPAPSGLHFSRRAQLLLAIGAALFAVIALAGILRFAKHKRG